MNRWHTESCNTGTHNIEFLVITRDGQNIVVGTGGKAIPKMGTLRNCSGAINYLHKEGIAYEEWDIEQIKTYINPEGL